MNNHLINKTVIVAGDMNMDLNSINDSLVDQYLSSLNSLNFVSVITEPTHFFNSINDTVSSTNFIFSNSSLNDWGLFFAPHITISSNTDNKEVIFYSFLS